jgi:hypothetical protein
MNAHLSATVAVAFCFPNIESSPMAASYVAEPSARYQTRFVDARARQCRFIVTDAAADEVVCCGAPTSETSSWCSWHRQVVFVPSRHDRDQRKAA